MNGIFISYRRDDASGYAGRLYDRLAGHFGADRVFMDVEGIEPGTDFVEAIDRAVGSCEILIVIIGREWLATDAKGRRRLDDPADFVRVETVMALSRGIRVVPVLVEGAAMPRADELPTELTPLVRRQAVELSHKQWDATSAELIQTLEKILDRAKAGTPDRIVAAPKPKPDVAKAIAQNDEPVDVPPPSQSSNANQRPARLYWGIGAALALVAVSALLYRGQPWRSNAVPPPSAPVLFVTPGKIEFADQALRANGAVAEVTLQNHGGSALHVARVRLDGAHAADFMLGEDQCSRRALAPEAACSIKVGFKPQTAGVRTAALVIDYDEAQGPAVVGMQGRGEESVVAQVAPPAVPPNPKPVTPPLAPPVTPPVTQPVAPPVSPSKILPKQKSDVATVPPKIAAVPQLVAVPSAIGKSRRDAVAALGSAGLDAQVIDAQPDAKTSSPADTVLAQSPAAGERVKPGERVTLQISAVVPPAVTAPSSFPRVGDSWQYNYRSMWKNVEPRTYTHQVTAVSDREVRETMSFPAGGNRTSDSKSFGPDNRLVEWKGQGYYFVEFNPFLQAFGALQPGMTWKSLATPIENSFFSNWYSQGRVVGWESISVPAGNFKALRVEVNSNRNASAGAVSEPARVWYVLWYAPDAKRTVKHVRTVFTTSGDKIAEDTYDLAKYALK